MECMGKIALRCFYMTFTWITIQGIVRDPCDNPSTLNADTLGSRNEKCPRPIPAQRLCDFRLEPAWYTIPFNGYLLDKCPAMGSCGTDFPAWINGTLPSDADGVVNRTCCIRRDVDCCAGNVTIQVKKCAANRYVYYLPSLQECDSVYCINTNLPCEQTTTTTTSTTSTTEASTHSSNEIGSSGSCDDKLTRILIGICTGALILLCGVSGVCLFLVCKLYCLKNKARVNVPKENVTQHMGPVSPSPPPPYKR